MIGDNLTTTEKWAQMIERIPEDTHSHQQVLPNHVGLDLVDHRLDQVVGPLRRRSHGSAWASHADSRDRSISTKAHIS